MNMSVTIPFTQLILSWMLLGALIAWMFFCACLALRPRKTRKLEETDLLTSSGAFPMLLLQVSPHRTSSAGESSLATVPVVVSESAGQFDPAPVA